MSWQPTNNNCCRIQAQHMTHTKLKNRKSIKIEILSLINQYYLLEKTYFKDKIRSKLLDIRKISNKLKKINFQIIK